MIKALENLSDRITVNYEGEPCYDIVFSKDFSEIGNELKKFNIENKKIRNLWLDISDRDKLRKPVISMGFLSLRRYCKLCMQKKISGKYLIPYWSVSLFRIWLTLLIRHI